MASHRMTLGGWRGFGIALLWGLAGCGGSSGSEAPAGGAPPAPAPAPAPAAPSPAPAPSTPPVDGSADVSVLMMGNSHTAANGLPDTLNAMLQAGLPGRTVSTTTAPNWLYLDERLTDGTTLPLLASRRWSVVVLQAQKYSTSGTVTYSTREARELIRRARAAGALPVLFPEWPQLGVDETLRIYDLHVGIAQQEPACVAPIGQAWDLAAQRLPGLALHASDGNHASSAGSYLTALMLYATATGASPLTVPDRSNGVAPAIQAQLRQIAADAAAATPPRQHCPADQRLIPAAARAPQDFDGRMDALWTADPRHHGAAYVAARAAARAGNETLALKWLDRLLALPPGQALGDALDPDDFAAIAHSPAYRQRAAAFAAAAPASGVPQRALETRCADLLPEGTAWDPKRRQLLLSSGRQRTVFALDDDGGCRPLVPRGDGGLLAVLGMAVDAGSDSLWVASAAAPFMRDARAEEAGTTLLARIDLRQGRTVQTWRLPGPGLLNDVALTIDGSVYATESQGGTVYRLKPGRRELEPLFAAGTFEGPNGIAALDADTLVVADFHGLWLVSGAASASPSKRHLEGPDGQYLGGFDGIARHGSRLVGIQNLAGLSRVWSLGIDRHAARVDARLLLRGHADLRNPTTGAVADGRFHFIADPNLQALQANGTVSPLPGGRTGHRLLSLQLPEP